MKHSNFKALLVVSLLFLANPSWSDDTASTTGPARPTSAQDAAKIYNNGVEAFNRHDLPTAEKSFKCFVDFDPNSADGHSNYGNTLVLAGKYDEAMIEFNKAIAIDPSKPAIWAGLGTCNQATGNLDAAVTAYKKFLALEPTGEMANRVKSTLTSLEGETRTSKNGIANGETDYLGDATQGGITRWPPSRMPIRVFIKTGTDVKGYRQSFESLLREAFQDWIDAGKGKIKIEYVPQIGDAELICAWTSNPKEMISSAEGGHAMVVPDKEGILKTTLYLLTVDQNSGAPISDNIARRVDLHEIGHSLGLLGHSRAPGDVMYSTFLPTDSIPSLTERDKNTVVALYSLDDATVRLHPIGSGDMMIAGDSTSLVVRAARANHDAVDAMKNKNFPLAIQKLEEAHKLEPANDLYTGNLGLAYGNIAAMALMLGNAPQADQYFQKAIPMAEKCPSKANVIAILRNYCTLLHATKRDAEAGKYEAKIKALSGQ